MNVKKYFEIFQSLAEYNIFKTTTNYCLPSVYLIKEDYNNNQLIFNNFSKTIEFGDILYVNSTTGLRFVTPQILPSSDGFIPIGLCIIAENELGNNSEARFMSLKYMDNYNPDNGNSETSRPIYWGDHINLIRQGSVNDVNGKEETALLLSHYTAENYRVTISNTNGVGYYPAAGLCWRYHTLGTNQGDWYLGAAGEMVYISKKLTEIQTKLQQISTEYPNHCMSNVRNDRRILWSSTERASGSDGGVTNIRVYGITNTTSPSNSIGYKGTNNYGPVVALIKYRKQDI